MASLSIDANENCTIQFVGADKKRRTIRLGKVPKKLAESVKLRVERLTATQLVGRSPDEEASQWLAS